MIDQNLFFINSFLKEPDMQLIASLESKLCPAEEMGHEYSRLVEQSNSDTFELDFRINPIIVKKLTSKEKNRIYTILRIISIATDSGAWKSLLEDYNNLLRKRGFRHERYLYLNSLSDSYFAYEIDCILTKGTTSRRNFYREIKSKYCKNTLTLEELLLKYFKIKLIRLNKKHPIRLQRHKGYRDHGSLGTGDRTLERDIQTDIWIQKREEERKKKTEDLLAFLRGLNGSE
jgi:hypothetical protein